MKTRIKRINPSWPLVVIGISGAIFGMAIGAAGMQAVQLPEVQKLAAANENLKNKVQLMESTLSQFASTSSSLTEPPAQTAQPAVEAPVEPASAPAATATAAPAAKPGNVAAPVAAKPAAPAVKPSPPVPPKPAIPPQRSEVIASAPPSPPIPPVQASPAPVQPVVSKEEVERAMKGRIEGVSSAKAGIAKLNPSSVDFINGRSVRLGEVFPSGEKLLSVDVANKRLITDHRQIILLD